MNNKRNNEKEYYSPEAVVMLVQARQQIMQWSVGDATEPYDEEDC